MNISINLLPGGSSHAKSLVNQSVSKIPPELHCIFPDIEVYLVTPEELNARLVKLLTNGVHFSHGENRGWYMATIPKDGGICTILLTVQKIVGQSEQYRLMKGLLVACLRCAWAQQRVAEAVENASDAAEMYKQRPETLLVEGLPPFILANKVWLHCNGQEMDRFYRHLLEQIQPSEKLDECRQ